VCTLGVLSLSLGSAEDRIVVVVFWLAIVLLPVEHYVHQLAGLTAKIEPLRYALLSIIGLIWAWASARFRGGGGPFHLQIAGIWRGYPFPFEEWIFIFNPASSSLREFHWLGLVGDVLIPSVVFVAVARWLQRCGAPVDNARAFLLVGFTITFVWLNVDSWVGGLPATWIGSQTVRYLAQLQRGFPIPYEGVLSFPEWQWPVLAIDLAIGLTSWAALYSARPLTHAIQSRLM